MSEYIDNVIDDILKVAKDKNNQSLDNTNQQPEDSINQPLEYNTNQPVEESSNDSSQQTTKKNSFESIVRDERYRVLFSDGIPRKYSTDVSDLSWTIDKLSEIDDNKILSKNNAIPVSEDEVLRIDGDTVFYTPNGSAPITFRNANLSAVESSAAYVAEIKKSFEDAETTEEKIRAKKELRNAIIADKKLSSETKNALVDIRDKWDIVSIVPKKDVNGNLVYGKYGRVLAEDYVMKNKDGDLTSWNTVISEDYGIAVTPYTDGKNLTESEKYRNKAQQDHYRAKGYYDRKYQTLEQNISRIDNLKSNFQNIQIQELDNGKIDASELEERLKIFNDTYIPILGNKDLRLKKAKKYVEEIEKPEDVIDFIYTATKTGLKIKLSEGKYNELYSHYNDKFKKVKRGDYKALKEISEINAVLDFVYSGKKKEQKRLDTDNVVSALRISLDDLSEKELNTLKDTAPSAYIHQQLNIPAANKNIQTTKSKFSLDLPENGGVADYMDAINSWLGNVLTNQTEALSELAIKASTAILPPNKSGATRLEDDPVKTLFTDISKYVTSVNNGGSNRDVTVRGVIEGLAMDSGELYDSLEKKIYKADRSRTVFTTAGEKIGSLLSGNWFDNLGEMKDRIINANISKEEKQKMLREIKVFQMARDFENNAYKNAASLQDVLVSQNMDRLVTGIDKLVDAAKLEVSGISKSIYPLFNDGKEQPKSIWNNELHELATKDRRNMAPNENIAKLNSAHYLIGDDYIPIKKVSPELKDGDEFINYKGTAIPKRLAAEYIEKSYDEEGKKIYSIEEIKKRKDFEKKYGTIIEGNTGFLEQTIINSEAIISLIIRPEFPLVGKMLNDDFRERVEKSDIAGGSPLATLADLGTGVFGGIGSFKVAGELLGKGAIDREIANLTLARNAGKEKIKYLDKESTKALNNGDISIAKKNKEIMEKEAYKNAKIESELYYAVEASKKKQKYMAATSLAVNYALSAVSGSFSEGEDRFGSAIDRASNINPSALILNGLMDTSITAGVHIMTTKSNNIDGNIAPLSVERRKEISSTKINEANIQAVKKVNEKYASSENTNASDETGVPEVSNIIVAEAAYESTLSKKDYYTSMGAEEEWIIDTLGAKTSLIEAKKEFKEDYGIDYIGNKEFEDFVKANQTLQKINTIDELAYLEKGDIEIEYFENGDKKITFIDDAKDPEIPDAKNEIIIEVKDGYYTISKNGKIIDDLGSKKEVEKTVNNMKDEAARRPKIEDEKIEAENISGEDLILNDIVSTVPTKTKTDENIEAEVEDSFGENARNENDTIVFNENTKDERINDSVTEMLDSIEEEIDNALEKAKENGIIVRVDNLENKRKIYLNATTMDEAKARLDELMPRGTDKDGAETKHRSFTGVKAGKSRDSYIGSESSAHDIIEDINNNTYSIDIMHNIRKNQKNYSDIAISHYLSSALKIPDIFHKIIMADKVVYDWAKDKGYIRNDLSYKRIRYASKDTETKMYRNGDVIVGDKDKSLPELNIYNIISRAYDEYKIKNEDKIDDSIKKRKSSELANSLIRTVIGLEDTRPNKKFSGFVKPTKHEVVDIIEVKKRKAKVHKINTDADDFFKDAKEKREEITKDIVEWINLTFGKNTVSVYKDNPKKISKFSRNKNSPLFDSYGFSDKPMSGFDILVMLGEATDFESALRFYNDKIKGNTYIEPSTKATYVDSKAIETTTQTRAIENAFPNTPKTKETRNGWLNELLTARGLNETVKDVNLKDLVLGFFDNDSSKYKLEMRKNKHNDSAIIARNSNDEAIRVRSNNKFYRGNEKFHIDNFKDGEPETVIFVENMFDAIGYIGVRLRDGDIKSSDLERLRIVDMGSITEQITKEQALRFIGKNEDVDIHYAADQISGGEHSIAKNKENLDTIKKNINDASEKITGVKAIVHEADSKDFNDVFKRDDVVRMLKNIEGKTIGRDEEYKPAVRVAIEELGDLMSGVFKKNDVDSSLNNKSKDKGGSYFNIMTAKIHLADDATWKTVFHEIIHSIQESNVFFKNPKGGYTKSQQDMVDLMNTLSTNDGYLKLFGSSKNIFRDKFEAELALARLDEESKHPHNTAIKEVLNNMLIDKELGEWMNTHKILRDNEGNIAGFEKVETNLDGTSNIDSVFSRIMNAIKSVVDSIININKESIYGTMVQAIEDGINNGNGKAYLDSSNDARYPSSEASKILYSRDKHTIDKYLSKPTIIEAISLATERYGNLSTEKIASIVDEIGLKRYGQRFSDLYSSGWEKISETYFGEIARKGKKTFDTIVSGSQEESDALIDHRNIMEKMMQTSLEAANAWKKINQESYKNMHNSNEDKQAISTLIKYDIKSMRLETISKVIDAIKDGNVNELQNIHNESRKTIENFRKFLEDRDSTRESILFTNSIAKLQNLLFRNSLTYDTPHNASVIFERHFKEYNFTDVQRRRTIAAIDEFISTKAIWQAVKNKEKLRDTFKNIEEDKYKDFFISFAKAARNISDVGRKGELKRSDLINSRVFAMKEEIFDALPIEEKKEFNKYKVIEQGTDEFGKPLNDGYIHFVQPDYTLPSQETDIRGVIRDNNNDADIEVSEEAIKQMNKQLKAGGNEKLEKYIVDNYYSETDKNNYYKDGLRNTGNIYPLIRNEKVVGLKKMLPRESIEDNSVNFLDIVGNHIQEAKYKSDSSKQHNIFMEKYGFNKKRFTGVKEEASFIKTIKKYLNPDEKETKDIPIDLIFLSDNHFLHKRGEFSELAITKAFKDKYKKIGDKDYLPDDMSDIKYVRRDFYDQVVKQKELLVDSDSFRYAIKTWMDIISTSKMAITIADPKTLLNNIVFNSTIVATHAGVSTLESLNNIRKHYSSYTEYFSMKEDLAIMSLKNGNTKEARKKIREETNSLKKKIENHEMYYYDKKMNLFNLKVDTVNVDASSQKNRFYRFVGEMAQSLNKNFEYGGKTKATRNISKAASFAFFADGSKTKNFGSAMARLGDEIPKIEIFNIIKSEELAKGKTEKEAEKFARNYAMDQFVDSRKNVDSKLSLADRTVFPFAKWTWQKLKSSAAMAKRKKFNSALVSILVYNMIDDDNGKDLFLYGSVDSGYGFMFDVIMNSDEKIANLDPQTPNIVSATDSVSSALDRAID